jgi:hypothetical protein
MLASTLSERSASHEVSSVIVQRKRSAGGLAWHLTPTQKSVLTGARVLVVDTAAGHGRTIDHLVRLVAESSPSTIGAAVLLSRLAEACQDAFEARLNGGFCWLYHFPIRPVVIRGRDAELCPVCRRRSAIRQAGHASGIDAVRRWSDSVTRRFRRPSAARNETLPKDKQLKLFPHPDDFFCDCRESVASGVTLHALNAAMNNGMAPLSLPEILNGRIPSRVRAAMVENLPEGAIQWSGATLKHDLREFLEHGSEPNVWRASAEVLARAGYDEWLGAIGDLLPRVRNSKYHIRPAFWSHVACTAYLTAADSPESRMALRSHLEQLVEANCGTREEEGLRLVLGLLSK